MKKNNNTYKEIMSQTRSWRSVYDDICNDKWASNLRIFSEDYDEIILFGCGSSYNLSLSASFLNKLLLKSISSEALPSSELLINTDAYIKKDKKYIIVGFSRSGETTETINVLKKLNPKKNIKSMVYSCKKNSAVTRFSDYEYVCKDASEKSIVMTVSFSSMLLAYCLSLAKIIKNEEMINEFGSVIDYVDKNMVYLFNELENYFNDNDFNSYFVLGSGFNYGLSLEAGLKMKEMSQTPSFSYHLHELSHGPKALLNSDSLSLILNLNKKLFKSEEIIMEILNLGSKVLLIGDSIKKINKKNIYYLLCNRKINFDFIEAFINIPIFQILAYIKTINKKLNPDKPLNLTYTVKGYNQ
jgi:glutamine---fructose-6-phosphate transaminase (isomerizing)